MSFRYEVTPGNGLVARHLDSVVWVGEDATADAWEGVGAVLELTPGTDPSGADLAAKLDALDEFLRAYPDTVFAALLIHDGQAQGILRGPAMVCNRSEIAPATGYENYGITVPFAMSESVYVGNQQIIANPEIVAALVDLDAGIVPGGGAWAHPVSTGRRHSGATGVHSLSATAGDPAESAPEADVSAPPTSESSQSEDDRPSFAVAGESSAAAGIGASSAAGLAAGAAAFGVATTAAPAAAAPSTTASTDFPDSSNPTDADPVIAGADGADVGSRPQPAAGPDSTMQFDPFADEATAQAPSGDRALADATDSASSESGSPESAVVAAPETSAISTPDESPSSANPDSGLGWPEPAPSAAQRPVSDWLPNSQPSALGTEGAAANAAAGGPLPPVTNSDAMWAEPSTSGANSAAEVGIAGGAAGEFTPAPDFERVELHNAASEQPAPALAPITSSAAANAEAPSAGVILFDDGSTFALDRDYVLGRRPEKDSRVQTGQAAALSVIDPDTVLSSAHALISRRAGAVFLQDLGSLNGSHVAPPGATDWTRLGAHQEVEIVPGTRLLFGWTVATYTGPPA